MVHSTSKKVPPERFARSEFSFPTPFVFHVNTESQKRAIVTDAINFTDNLVYISKNFLPFEKHCIDVHSIPLIREHHDFILFYLPYKTCERSFANLLVTVVCNPVKNNITEIFPRTISPTDLFLLFQDVFVLLLIKNA